MFSKFNFDINNKIFFDSEECKSCISCQMNREYCKIFNKYYKIGFEQFKNHKRLISDSMEQYLDAEGTIDIIKLEEDWFNNDDLNADIFLSHSHKDRNLAIAFAGWLEENFKLKSFIDSCVWGDSNILLHTMDEKYSRIDKNVPGHYDYGKALISSSHVHMILADALMKMINKTECFMFLNTDNSIISVKEEMTKSDDKRTYSPWIYLEINIANLLGVTLPERYKKIEKNAKYFINESVQSKFPADIHKLKYVDNSVLIHWKSIYKQNEKLHPLDLLYKLQNCLISKILS